MNCNRPVPGTTLKCPGSIKFITDTQFICDYCQNLTDVQLALKLNQDSNQNTTSNNTKDINYLRRCFDIPKESKTLKLKKNPNFTLAQHVNDAYTYIQNNIEGYTRIEFKYENTYIVVAKLKDEK